MMKGKENIFLGVFGGRSKEGGEKDNKIKFIILSL